MKALKFMAGMVLLFSILLFSCVNPVAEDEPSGDKIGDIAGNAYFSNTTDHGGISIILEKTNGLQSVSVLRSVETGRAVGGTEGTLTTVTDSGGRYSFSGVAEGTYSIYAASRNSKERAVTANVTVQAGRQVTAEDLNLTPVGHIRGTITVDGNDTGNTGFLVFIASTSYMAATNGAGDFLISDVPVGSGYQIIIMKGTYITLWTTAQVTTGSTTPLGVKNLYAADINAGGGTSLIWKGSLAVAPEDPQLNWAYHNTAEGASYIYDGASWQILAQNGSSGISLVWKGSLTAAPEGPQTNWAYYNSTEGTSYIWDGAAWQVMAVNGQNGATGQAGPAGAAGLDGVSLVWKGSLTGAPSNPQTNWAYYNSTQGTSYIWDGTAWQVIAMDGQGGEGGAGASLVWKGSFTEAPANPQTNWAYYNTSERKSYIYDGTGWQVFAQDGNAGADGVSLVWKGSLTAAPSNPQTNWAYYNSIQGTSYIWDGGRWQILAKDGANGTEGQEGEAGASGLDGVSLVWKGSLSSAPTNPQMNWAYYNTTEKKSYIYDGSSWYIIAQDGVNGEDGQPGQDGATGPAGQDGISLVWKGSLTAVPEYPQMNWAYYNTTEKKSYIYDGAAWQVFAQDGKDGQDLTIGSIPATPMGFAALPVLSTASSVTLQWNPSTNAESYKVLIADAQTGQYDPVQLVNITFDGTRAQVSGLAMNRTYWFKVCAINAYGESGLSAAASANTSAVATEAPAAPANVGVSILVLPGYNEVTLVWDQVPGAEYYQIYKSNTEDGTYTVAGDRIAPVFSSGAATGLTGNTAYWFRVAAGSAAGESLLSAAVSASTSASAIALPDTPTNFRVAAQSYNSITFQWDNVTDISGYKVYFSEYIGGPFVPRADDLTTTSTVITGLAANRDYYFKVAAKNSAGESRESDTLMASTTPQVTQVYSSSSYSDYYPSTVVDGSGKVHVVYNRGNDWKLFYATNASGAWTAPVEIDGVQTGTPSLRIDGAGKLHAAYWDKSSGYVKYATNASGSWTTLVVDNGGGLGAGAALALDGDGNVYISYHDYTNNIVKYATNKSGSWEIGEVVQSVERYGTDYNVSTGIGVDSAGIIYIAYSCYAANANTGNLNELYGVSKSPGALWGVPDKILESRNSYGSYGYFNLDMRMSNDTPHFIYSELNNLGLVFREGGVWKAGILDAACYSSTGDTGVMKPSLAVDDNGALYVSYQARLDNGQYSLKYGTNAGGAWRFRTPVGLLNGTSTSYNAGLWSGIGVDTAGKVHIAYHRYDDSNPSLSLNYLTW
ncbi:MAG: fibronectin type III domain-containing protein [Treponema sp.]|nr:fibronectin type III domain-containing protein [Treponema sp.]